MLMPRSACKVFAIALALLLAAAAASLFYFIPATMGEYDVALRVALAESSIILLMVAAYLIANLATVNVWEGRSRIRLLLSGLFALLALSAPPWYFFSHLSGQSESGVSAQQLASSLITQSTSNGIVEVGFAYPIYTPTLSLSNHDLYTRRYDVYLNMVDANGESMLFRAVRQVMPDARLTVENTVQGMLSRNPDYLFLPIVVAPNASVSGKVVFVISDLRDGTSFDDALGRSYKAEFEIRNPDDGALLLSFPLTRI